MRELPIGYNAGVIFLSLLFASFNSSRGLAPLTTSSRNSVYPPHTHSHRSTITRYRTTRFLSKKSSNDDNDVIPRRESILKFTSVAATATASLLSTCLSSSNPALAAEAIDGDKETPTTVKKEYTEYQSQRNKFSISVPSTFKIITNKTGSETPSVTSGQIFSTIDLSSGTVVTVHRENACPVDRYVSQPKACDLVLPSEPDGALLSERTLERDAKKMVIRHDDRDNAVLGGTSTLQSVERVGGADGGIAMVANTVLPTGGTYQDEMGLRRESTITRVVKARVVVQTDGNGNMSLLGIWVSSPLDEWQKPVMGTRLRQIVDSIHIEGGLFNLNHTK